MCAISVLLVLACASRSVAAIASDNRAALCEIEAEGPLSAIVVHGDGAGETRVSGALLAGERRKLTLPVPLQHAASRLEPKIEWSSDATIAERALDGGGRVRFLGWRASTEENFERLPAGLRARPRPPLDERALALPAACLPLLAACFALSVSLRRKPVIACVLAFVASAALYALTSAASDATQPTRVRVLEGSADSTAWLQVDAAREHLVLHGALEHSIVESRPSDAPLVWRVSIDGGEAGAADAQSELVGAHVELYRLSVREQPEGSLTRAANRMGTFAQTWVREQGAWTTRGAWELERALPEAGPGAEHGPPAPGWLATGLPQGISIVLGQLADTPDGTPTFVRFSGL